jgi:hypothetical protein
MGSAVRARQEKKNKPANPLSQAARAQAPKKKISASETAILVGIPIVFGLCVSYLFSRAVKRLRGDYMLGVFPKDAKGLKTSVLLMVVGRVGYVGLDLLKRRVKAVEARARADQAAAAAPAAAAAQKKDE